MTHIREDLNYYGTPVTWMRCDSCGRDFSVCPALEEDRREQWNGCMAEECDSYEPTRDAELYFALDMVERKGNDDQEGRMV